MAPRPRISPDIRSRCRLGFKGQSLRRISREWPKQWRRKLRLPRGHDGPNGLHVRRWWATKIRAPSGPMRVWNQPRFRRKMQPSLTAASLLGLAVDRRSRHPGQNGPKRPRFLSGSGGPCRAVEWSDRSIARMSPSQLSWSRIDKSATRLANSVRLVTCSRSKRLLRFR
jgi:hypothetical protein